jgi:CysZ protein
MLSALKLLGISVLLNLLVLPAYFVPGLNLPVWLALNGYLVGREYAEMVATRRLAPAAADRARGERRLTFWAAGVVVAALLAVPVLNLVAPIVGAAFMTLRFQRYGHDATRYLRE